MFKTKSEVDKHVGKMFLKARSDTEKNRECFKIARLYFGVREYECAKMYLANYLSENTSDPGAWKLMADIAELSDKNMLKAIDCYIKCYELDEANPKPLLKICECYLGTKEKYEANKAGKWLEKAEQHFPYEKAVVELRERLFAILDTTSSNDWEQFLLKALNDNYYNEELHLKLVKSYLKAATRDENTYKAIRHIHSIEQRSQFDSSTNWHSTVIELIESSTHCLPNTTSSSHLVNLINLSYLIIIYHQILLNLQAQNSNESILSLFVKFDKALYLFDDYLTKQKVSPDGLGLKLPYQLIVLDEIKAQFYFVCGLVALKLSNGRRDHLVNVRPVTPLSDDIESYDSLSSDMLATVCLANSSLLSKPNNKELFAANIETLNALNKAGATRSELTSTVLGLVKLVHRDSNWRFSIIGNWLKYQLDNSEDEIKLLRQIKSFAKSSNIRQAMVDSIGQGLLHKSSFLMKCRFEIENENFFVDHLSVDFADKYCLMNQAFNLKYLVWHTLVNTRIKSNTNLSDMGKHLPYFYFRNSANNSNAVKFGVNNFNICNLESLSLIDMKIFLCSTAVQAFQYFLNKSDSKKGPLNLQPYWLQPQLCSDKQSDWWFNCFNFMYNRKQTGSPKKLTIELLENSTKNFSLDIKKQTDCARVLELLRLKHGLIKLQNPIRNEQETFQINLNVAVQVAKHLQALVDKIKTARQSSRLSYLNDNPDLSTMLDRSSILINKCLSNTNNLIQSGTCGTLAAEFETEYSPQEKLEHLQRISVHYWNYITKQMIKLKQLKLIDTENNTNESKNFGSVSFSSNANDSSVMPNNRSSFSPLSNRRAYEAKYYFEFEDTVSEVATRLEDGYDLCDEAGTDELEVKACDQIDEDELTIQSGLLNLILDCIEPHEVYDVQQLSIRLKEAILLFNTMNQNLEDKYKIDLNYYHLQLCKKIAEYLIEQREIVEGLLKRETDECLTSSDSCKLGENLQDINVLIDFIKKKINACFMSKKLTPPRENIILLNSVTQVVQADVSLETNLELDTTVEENVEPVEKEEQLTPTANFSIHIETVEVKGAQLVDSYIQTEEIVSVPEVSITVESAPQLEDKITQTQQTEQDIERAKVNVEQNAKILGLIETLNMQRMAHLKFNTQHLTEQFQFVNDQFKKINHEIKQLGSCTAKRKAILSDFRQTIDEYNELCNADIFYKQFNVFYWLFQQQPNYSQYFLEQNKQYLEAFNSQTKQVDPVRSDPPEYDLVTPTHFNEEPKSTPPNADMTSTSQFMTPHTQSFAVNKGVAKSASSNTPQQFLEKPIGEINFPQNLDLLSQLQNSADKFNLERSQMEDYDDDEDEYEGDEGDEGDDEDYQEEIEQEIYENKGVTNNLSQSKLDSFQSCDDNDMPNMCTQQSRKEESENNLSFKSFTKNNSTQFSLEMSKSSIKDLEIQFDQYGVYYSYKPDKNVWQPLGHANIQIISDEGISQKGVYQAFIICNLTKKNQSIQYNINKATLTKRLHNSGNCICWYDAADRCGAILFEDESAMNELQTIIGDCQNRMSNSSSQPNKLNWSPPLTLGSGEHLVRVEALLEKQVTFNINQVLNFACVTLVMSDFNDKKLRGSKFLISIEDNSKVLFQHAIHFNQKFNVSEKPKQSQFFCNYELSANMVIIDNSNANIELKEPLNVRLTFSSKQALAEFISLFDN